MDKNIEFFIKEAIGYKEHIEVNPMCLFLC